MNDKSDVRTAMKTLKERAAQDEQLMKLLQEMDELLLEAEGSEMTDQGRSHLPYSSDPPVLEAWK
jgi:hypothetical protein